MQIPLTKEFTIEHEFMDGTKKVGQFTAHKLNMGEKIRVGVLKTRMGDGLSDLGKTYDDYAEAVALCRMSLTDKPDWFDPEDIVDDTLLWKVYREVAELETAIFRTRAKKGNSEGNKDTTQQPEVENVGG